MKNKYSKEKARKILDSFAKGGRLKSALMRDRNNFNHFEKHEIAYSKNKPHRKGYGYANGGEVAEVGEPYDSMTKYQLEKELNKLTDEYFDIRKSYNTNQHPRQLEIEKEKDKIITLLYGENFSGKGRKYRYNYGGTILGVAETPLANQGLPNYSGLVGETGAMSSGEMFMNGGSTGLTTGAEQHFVNYYLNEGASAGIFAEGGSIGSMINFEDWQLWDRDTDLERMKKSCNAIRKNGFKAIVVQDKSIYYVLYKSMSDSQGKRVYAEGGSIKNQYEGKTAEEVWNNLSISQRYHFLNDHKKEIESTPASIEKATKTAFKFLPLKMKNSFKKHVSEGQYAKGGRLKSALMRDRNNFNHFEKHEIAYSKNKPHRKGYGYANGGKLSKNDIDKLYLKSNFINQHFNWKGKLLEMLQDNSKEAYNIYQSLSEKEKEEVLQELYELDNDMGSYGDGDIETTKENLEYILEGAKDGQDYAKGGVTKNYISRNNLNTITIKKGNEKLTYKVSDVYNGAYKLESGGKIESVAFYVPKRNIVKVQLKNGSNIKVANGYWIKKGAKPIHVSKFEDGGQMPTCKTGKHKKD